MIVSSSWDRPPDHPSALEGDVHIWRAMLAQHAPQLVALAATLTPDERHRASRFRFVRDRDRFVLCRGLLRAILARYVQVAPAALRFSYGPAGKPRLADPRGILDLRFNLSHTDGLALFAVARGREMGLDVERIDETVLVEPLARHAFAPAEVAYLANLPTRRRREAFYRLWTVKEAYVKARGEGLSMPLNEFEAIPAADGQVHIHATGGDAQVSSRWSVCPLDPGPGYVATLAAQGKIRQLAQWTLAPP